MPLLACLCARAAAGVFAAGPDFKAVPKPELHLCAKKSLSLFDGPRTVVSAKAWGNFDPQSGTVSTHRLRTQPAQRRTATHTWASGLIHTKCLMGLCVRYLAAIAGYNT